MIEVLFLLFAFAAGLLYAVALLTPPKETEEPAPVRHPWLDPIWVQDVDLAQLPSPFDVRIAQEAQL